MLFETIPQMILTAGSDRGAADGDAVHGETGWVATSWRAYAEEIMATACGLIASE